MAGNALFSDAAANTLSLVASLPDAAPTPGTTSMASSASTSTTHDIFFMRTLPCVPRPAIVAAAHPTLFTQPDRLCRPRHGSRPVRRLIWQAFVILRTI